MRLSSISLAASVLLVACGGGGGGNDSPAIPSTPVSTQLVLTPANYSIAAQESASSALYMVSSAGLVTGAETASNVAWFDDGVTLALQAARWFGTTASVASGAVTTATQTCPGGGNMTLSANDANGNNLVDAGDGVSITANNCKVNADTLSGGISITFTALTGNVDSSVYTATADVVFTSLKATTAAGTSTGNGTLRLAIVSRALNNATVSLSTASFASSATFGGVVSSRTLSAFSSFATVSPNPLSNSLVITNSNVASSALDGKLLNLATITPFVRTGSNIYPSSGQAIISGANGAKIRLTAINSTSVQIELDADANGTYEVSVTRAWSQLL